MNGEGASGRLVVIDSISPAIERTRAMLFSPFSFGIWLRFGLIVFVEQLGRGGGGASYNTRSPGRFGRPADTSPPEIASNLWAMLIEYWFVVGIAVMLLFALGIVVLYFSCRTGVMLVRACAAGHPSLRRDWAETRDAGHSLFFLHLIFAAVMLSALAVALGIAVLAFAAGDGGFVIALIVLAAAVIVAAGSCVGVAASLTRNFVTPIMVRDNQGWQAAWRRMAPVFGANILPLIGYYLLKLCYFIVLVLVGGALGCATLCIGFLPVIQQTLLAPLHVFERNWSMVMLHYLGPGFEVFHETEPAPEALSDAPWAPPREDTP